MDNHSLVQALLDGPKTGVVLAQQLHISRAAVWKRIKYLRQSGLEIASTGTRAYAIKQCTPLLEEARIRQHLSATHNQMIRHMHIDFELKSTQSAAIATPVPASGVDVWLAESQTQGQGRRGARWCSPPLANIYCSMNRRFDVPMSKLAGLSLVLAVLIAEALQQLGFHAAQVKWPNDIWLDGKKCAGIIMHVQGEANGPCELSIGFGVNVQMSKLAGKNIDQAWTSLSEHNATDLNRNIILACIWRHILDGFEQFEQQGLAGFMARWQAVDGLFDKTVSVNTGQHCVLGRALGIYPDGALRIGYAQQELKFHSGDVQIRVQHD